MSYYGLPADYATSLILNRRTICPSHRHLADDLVFALAAAEDDRVYEILKKLKKPLGPKDAEDACQFAMNEPDTLLEAVLDHCVPVSEFLPQTDFLYGILATDDVPLLDCFLRRSADPNRMDTHSETAPLSYAFCHHAAACMERLMKEPSLLRPELTEDMLLAWGQLNLSDGESDAAFLRCCRMMCSALGMPADPDEPFPIPPQLRLAHALHHKNARLAAHLCRTRPLTEEDRSDVHAFFRKHSALFLPRPRDDSSPRDYAQFLDAFLQRFPESLHTPELRMEVVSTALLLPEEESSLMHWIERMDDGPVLLPELPLLLHTLPEGAVQIHADRNFGPHLAEHPSPRLILAIDARYELPALWLPDLLPDDALSALLSRLRVVGDRPDGKLSAAARQVLNHAPTDLLPLLMQPGRLLAEEPPHAMWEACEQLPPDRCNALLPFLRKETSSDL